MMINLVKDSFVVLSDFHAIGYPIDKINNYYLKEYEHIFILGDATDRGKDFRGSNGISILFQIKELMEKYPKRVHYIPGNHDKFLYDYAVYDDKEAEQLLYLNDGEKTIEDIWNVKRNNFAKFQEFTKWLGSQPLQITHEFNGQKYAMAHAFFNYKLFQKNPGLSLADCKMCDDKMIMDIKKILWFRVSKDSYNKLEVPPKEYIEVIGHTPLCTRIGVSLDLVNYEGDIVKVHCVDGGIAFGDDMLKYDGGSKSIPTRNIHCDTSPKNYFSNSYDDLQDFDEQSNKLMRKIFELLEQKDNDLDTIIIEEMEKLVKNITSGRKNSSKISHNPMLIKKITEFGFKVIAYCLLKNMNGIRLSVKNQLLAWIESNNANYIAYDGFLRFVAENIGIDHLKRCFPDYNYHQKFQEIIGEMYIQLENSPNYDKDQEARFQSLVLSDIISKQTEEGGLLKEIASEYFSLWKNDQKLLEKVKQDGEINFNRIRYRIRSALEIDKFQPLMFEDIERYIVNVAMDYITRESFEFQIQDVQKRTRYESGLDECKDECKFYAEQRIQTWLYCNRYDYIPSIEDNSNARLVAYNIGADNIKRVYGGKSYSYLEAIDASFARVFTEDSTSKKFRK